MPGKPFRSSLEPHFEEIAQRRMRRETWQEIAAALEKAHGLKVHLSAVQKFFGRHLAGRPRPLGFDPLPSAATSAAATSAPIPPGELANEGYGGPAYPDDENPFLMRRRQNQRTAVSGEQAAIPDAATPAPAGKKYVFIPKPKRPSIFSDEDMQLNDPLEIKGYGKPVDPDAENPFKMRKRPAS